MDCFKAYDIRGKVPTELNEPIAYNIGRAYASLFHSENVVVGHDMRHESLELSDALVAGLNDAGVSVIDLGLCGTEEVYYATAELGTDGGIMVTASHNPRGYGGMKLVGSHAVPLSSAELRAIRMQILSGSWLSAGSESKGSISKRSLRESYVKHMLSYVNDRDLRPLTLVADPGNGCAGPVVAELAKYLPYNIIFQNETPDGSFPNGVPNPLLPENRIRTAQAVLDHKADLGIAWDGDFDRCFFYDSSGRFIEGYYIVGLLAQMLLQQHPGQTIIHDPRLTWNTIEMVQQARGKTIQSKTGHAFMKQYMRQYDALYGGEMSAHHYFRSFHYCDSGMIPWLLITQLMCQTGQTLAQLVDDRIKAYPCSGELNFTVSNPQQIIERVHDYYRSSDAVVDFIDGLSMGFSDWRFNLRSSNTEPLLRLNVESRVDEELMREKTKQLSYLISSGEL